MSSNLHPIFAAALAPFAPQDSTVRRIAEYQQALRTFDWAFEFSDDHATWCKGDRRLRELRAMQAELDPTGEIWRGIQPPGFGIPGPVVREVSA